MANFNELKNALLGKDRTNETDDFHDPYTAFNDFV